MNCCLFNWRSMARSSSGVVMTRRASSERLSWRRRLAKRGLCRVRIRGQIKFGQQKVRGCCNVRIFALVNQLNAIFKQCTRHCTVFILVAVLTTRTFIVARVQYVARKTVQQQGDGSLEGVRSVTVVGVITATCTGTWDLPLINNLWNRWKNRITAFIKAKLKKWDVQTNFDK